MGDCRPVTALLNGNRFDYYIVVLKWGECIPWNMNLGFIETGINGLDLPLHRPQLFVGALGFVFFVCFFIEQITSGFPLVFQ